MWQGKDGKQGQCFSAVVLWLCSKTATATPEV